MCTLTFVPTEDGYVAGMNRDEKLTRARAIPPKCFDFPGATALFPRESSGGTWIGCNSHGNLLALLNWNDVTPPFGGAAVRSRGVLIPGLIGADDVGDTHARYSQLDLNGVLPFRLIGEPRIVSAVDVDDQQAVCRNGDVGVGSLRPPMFDLLRVT